MLNRWTKQSYNRWLIVALPLLQHLVCQLLDSQWNKRISSYIWIIISLIIHAFHILMLNFIKCSLVPVKKGPGTFLLMCSWIFGYHYRWISLCYQVHCSQCWCQVQAGRKFQWATLHTPSLQMFITDKKWGRRRTPIMSSAYSESLWRKCYELGSGLGSAVLNTRIYWFGFFFSFLMAQAYSKMIMPGFIRFKLWKSGCESMKHNFHT